jgi:hypothetical protein
VLKGARHEHEIHINLSATLNAKTFEGYPLEKGAVRAAVYEDMRGRQILKNPLNH